MRINLTDNNIRQTDSGTFNRKDVSALFPIADKTIVQIVQVCAVIVAVTGIESCIISE